MKTNTLRHNEILDAVVRLNIETGRPVGSHLVERYLNRAYSSATIRSVMRGLEQDGLLEQPHTSAGRRPTDAGFRRFVDAVLTARPLQAWDPPRHVQRAVADSLQRHAGGEAIARELARQLSRLTANISIILGPSWEDVRAVRLELYRKEGRRVLLVLVLENALVRTGLVVPRENYGADLLADAAQILSERVSGRTLAEIRAGVIDSLFGSTSAAERCAADLARHGRDLFADLEVENLELEGVAQVLDEPEFSAPEQLKALIRFIESPRAMRDALHRLRRETVGDLGVWIGRENPIDELTPFSLLAGTFALENRPGILAVLGPKRMPYQRAFAGIDVVRETLRGLSAH
jgi:heat-inducible transcriptional repressor